jgi:hypothetical protein
MTCSLILGTRLPRKTLPDLIVQLRAAANVKDGYELQQELIGHVRETEEARNAFSKAVNTERHGPGLSPPGGHQGGPGRVRHLCGSV